MYRGFIKCENGRNASKTPSSSVKELRGGV